MELRQAQLPDRMAIYTRWFDSCKDADGNVTRSAIARLFVKIGLARDFETASIQLDGRLKELTDQRIITLGVFKLQTNDKDVGHHPRLSESCAFAQGLSNLRA